jgi:drug/metabolite transporter (DMT)-like permease
MTVTCLRWSLAALIALPFAYQPLRQDWDVIKKHGWVLFALGALGLGSFNMLMYQALTETTAVNVSILQASMPVLIFLLNFAVLGLRVKTLQILGLAVSVFGVLITCTRGNPLSFFSEGLNRGDATMLVACLVYASYTFGLRWRPDIHWMSFMFVVALSAAVGSAPFMLWELQAQPFVVPGWRGWAVVTYAIIFPTFVSQIAYAIGVKSIGGNRAGLFINLVPIFGSILAVLILQEAFRWYHGIGLVLVVGGILVAEMAATKKVNA